MAITAWRNKTRCLFSGDFFLRKCVFYHFFHNFCFKNCKKVYFKKLSSGLSRPFWRGGIWHEKSCAIKSWMLLVLMLLEPLLIPDRGCPASWTPIQRYSIRANDMSTWIQSLQFWSDSCSHWPAMWRWLKLIGNKFSLEKNSLALTNCLQRPDF